MAALRPMTERERELLEVLKRPVTAEQQAQAMYEEALACCDDPVLTVILQSFHDDECRHEREVIGRCQQFHKDFETGE